MKKLRHIIFFVFVVSSVAGQDSKSEKLIDQLSTEKSDTTRVNILFELSTIYMNSSKPDSALLLANQGLELARSVQFLEGEKKCMEFICNQSWILGDYSTSIKFGYPLLDLAKSTKDTSSMILAYAMLSNSYRDQGDYQEALPFVFKNIELFEASKSSDMYGVGYATVGSNYYGLGKYDSASYYLRIALSQPEGFAFGWILLMNGRTEAKLGNSEVAFEYLRKSIKRLNIEKSSKDLSGAYTSMAILSDDSAQPDSAIYFGELALNLAKQYNYDKEIYEAYLILSKVNENLHTEVALNYYKLAIAEKEKLFNQEKQRQITSYKFNEILKQNEVEAAQRDADNQLKLNALLGSTFTLLVVALLLFRNSRIKHKAKQNIEKAYGQLKSTQAQLVQSEKMASLGELTAGIAHEIQNPLNFVNNFSEVNSELIEEANQEIDKGNISETKEILNDLKENEEKIKHHGKRASGIVKGMLEHSRTGDGVKEPTDINALADEYLRLAYHGLRAKDKSFNADFKTEFDPLLPKVNVIPQDIGRVLLNLINNAFYAVDKKAKKGIEGYKPEVVVSTKISPSSRGIMGEDQVEISVKDNGPGIQEEIKDKIFQPFFTTKPTGSGTGLGLSLSYDIVKAHGGTLRVKSIEHHGTEFTILL